MGPPYGAGTTSRVLWIHGGPGTGKTFIAATAIEHLKTHSAYPTAYFICSHEDTAQNQPLAIVRSWIVQLASQRVEALRVLQLLKDEEPVATRVWDIFRTMIRGVGPCHLVLDGLDECLDYNPESKVSQVGSVKLFLQELLRSIGPERAKVLIVSRDTGDIRSGLLTYPQEGPYLLLEHSPMEYRITIKDTDNDIQSIASSLVGLLKIKNSDRRDDTLQKLSGRCEGMFLWLRLAGEKLKPGMRESKLTATLQSIPTGLDQAYKRDLTRILRLDETDRKWVTEILRWMLFSLRPLSVTELFHALSIIPDSDIMQHDDIPDPDDPDAIQSQILDLCGSFIDIRPSSMRQVPDQAGDQTLHFVHFSAKEFLLNGSKELKGSRFQELFYLTPATSHSILARSCLLYLLSDLERVVNQRFYRYASRSWIGHFHLSSAEGESQWIGLQRRLFMPGPSFDSWQADYQIPRMAIHLNPLEAASTGNLLDMAREIMANPQQFQKSGSTVFGLALHRAAMGGHKEMVELLIGGGVNINALDKNGKAALLMATLRGHSSVIKVLLAREDVELNFCSWNATALHVAAMQGDSQVVRLLLERKDVDVNVRTTEDATALHLAVIGGEMEVIQLLLASKDVDVNARQHGKLTPLHLAASLKNHAVIQLLLERKDVDVNACVENMITPLHMAVNLKNHVTVQALLTRKDVDVNAVNKRGQTLLKCSVDKGDCEAVRLLLLREDVDVNASDTHQTPLQSAVSHGNAKMVQLLLTREDLDVNAGTKTALHLAALFGVSKVVEILLTREDLDVNPSTSGVTPLDVASTLGHTHVVKQLQARGGRRNMGIKPTAPGELVKFQVRRLF